MWDSNNGFGWLRSLLHHTRVGRFITQHFWAHIRDVTLEDCGYRHDEALNILEPEQRYDRCSRVTGGS